MIEGTIATDEVEKVYGKEIGWGWEEVGAVVLRMGDKGREDWVLRRIGNK